jgi:uncharacterized Ntn-hydrolase superfamily protein
MLLCLAETGVVSAEDTFSIVAVDPITGEVGSAGASCISGSIIISDVHPGVGAIHTQSYWNGQNQTYARSLMDDGIPPQAIIDSLVAHDATGDPELRQYGVVDLVGGGRSAAYTGSSCITHADHLTAPIYAIAGNILLGQEILDDMEAAFLTTEGPLSDRLMAALQGANVPGADRRCLDDDKPAISAFIRVARPGDTAGDYHLDLNVNNTAPSQNPIDILQDLYHDWQGTVGVTAPVASRPLTLFPVLPNPFHPSTTIRYELGEALPVRLIVYDVSGREVATLVDAVEGPGVHHVRWDARPYLASGVYAVRIEAGAWSQTRRLTLLR